MSASPERFALARRGLPLPIASHATLKGAWLPAAVRNDRAPERPRTFAAPPVPAPPDPGDDQPWWMEASELVPANTVESASAMIASQPSASPRTTIIDAAQPARDANTASSGLTKMDSQRPTPDRDLPPTVTTRISSSVREVTTTLMGVPAGTSATPTHEAERSVAAASGIGPQYRNHEIAKRTERGVEPASAPNVTVISVEAAAPSSRDDESEEPPTQSHGAPALLGAHDVAMPARDHILETARSEMSSPARVTVRVDRMGSPSMPSVERESSTPDLSSLLSPRRPSERDIRIDRVAVTVQTPSARQPQTPTAAPAPIAPVAASTARTYRNPWASYFARRD